MQKKYDKYIEYACLDYFLNESELETNIVTAYKHGVTNFCVPFYSLSTIKNMPLLNNIKISCPVDFPYGLSDIKSRNFMVEQICKHSIKVSNIDIVMPTKIVCNRKYDKFREDVKTNLDIVKEKNINIRYILEYRRYPHDILAKICQILVDFGIKDIFPSSGTMIDDINDNLIACHFLQQKSKINTIVTGNIYNKKQANNMQKLSTLNSIRFFNLNAMLLFLDEYNIGV